MDGNVSSLKIAIAINRHQRSTVFFFFFKHIYKLSIDITTDSLTRAFLITSVCFIITYSFLKSLAVQTVRDHCATRETVSPRFCSRLGRRGMIIHLIFYYNDFFFLIFYVQLCGNVLMIMVTRTNRRPLRRLLLDTYFNT